MWIAYQVTYSEGPGPWEYLHLPDALVEAEVAEYLQERNPSDYGQHKSIEFYTIDYPPLAWLERERERQNRNLRALQAYLQTLEAVPSEEGTWMKDLVEKEKARILTRCEKNPKGIMSLRWAEPEIQAAEDQLVAEGKVRLDGDRLFLIPQGSEEPCDG